MDIGNNNIPKELSLRYADLSDREVVERVLAGDDNAMWYLIYDRYQSDMRFYCWRHYESYHYLKELCDELFIRLKGDAGDWTRLRAFQWKSSFRTWLSVVADNLFLGLRKEFVVFHRNMVQMEDEKFKIEDEKQSLQYVMMLEAINRLQNEEYRMVLIKELEGYKPYEIAEMMVQKRKKNGVVKRYNGEVVYPTADYVYNCKAKAIKELKVIINQIREE